MPVRKSGTISASLLVLILVAMAIGALVGLVLSGTDLSSRAIAIIAGLAATVIASLARYKIIFLGAGVGADDTRVPGLVVTYSAIASIAGSLAAHDLYADVIGQMPVLLGALAGLFSAIIMAMLMITYHTNTHYS
ncbi:MAG: hypothetical protein QM780_13265 [Hyphomicrobium sp.]|uniref:hypothetical protein n=1 Tax=Hyphomicrobium sp. TaxID=82 RepID=UPI0039E2F4B5